MLKRISVGIFIFGWVLLYIGFKIDNNMLLLLSLAFIIIGLVGLVVGARRTNWNRFPINKL